MKAFNLLRDLDGNKGGKNKTTKINQIFCLMVEHNKQIISGLNQNFILRPKPKKCRKVCRGKIKLSSP